MRHSIVYNLGCSEEERLFGGSLNMLWMKWMNWQGEKQKPS
jgi:hypothetical protein